MVNEHFFDERNAAGGHYGQTLAKGNTWSEPFLARRVSLAGISYKPDR